MKATDQYFPVVLFIMLYKVVLELLTESVEEILKRDRSNKSPSSTSVVLFIMPCKVVLTQF